MMITRFAFKLVFIELVEEVCHEINVQLPNVQAHTIYM